MSAIERKIERSFKTTDGESFALMVNAVNHQAAIDIIEALDVDPNKVEWLTNLVEKNISKIYDILHSAYYED